MRFLGDMGISLKAIQRLRKLGHDATHLHEEGLDRLPDREVLTKALGERRVLLTHDLDFGYLMAMSGASAPSIILFRLSDMQAGNVSKHLELAISQLPREGFGFFVTVSDAGIRIRKLPVGEQSGSEGEADRGG